MTESFKLWYYIEGNDVTSVFISPSETVYDLAGCKSNSPECQVIVKLWGWSSSSELHSV